MMETVSLRVTDLLTYSKTFLRTDYCWEARVDYVVFRRGLELICHNNSGPIIHTEPKQNTEIGVVPFFTTLRLGVFRECTCYTAARQPALGFVVRVASRMILIPCMTYVEKKIPSYLRVAP